MPNDEDCTVTFEFINSDNRLRGKVTVSIPTPEIWSLTLAQIVERTKPAILATYPYVAGTEDFCDPIEISIKPVGDALTFR